MRFPHAASMTPSAMRLPVIFSMPSLASLRASAPFSLTKFVRLDLALEQLLDDVGVVLEELGAHDQVGRHVLAVRPQVALVDEHLARRPPG